MSKKKKAVERLSKKYLKDIKEVKPLKWSKEDAFSRISDSLQKGVNPNELDMKYVGLMDKKESKLTPKQVQDLEAMERVDTGTGNLSDSVRTFGPSLTEYFIKKSDQSKVDYDSKIQALQELINITKKDTAKTFENQMDKANAVNKIADKIIELQIERITSKSKNNKKPENNKKPMLILKSQIKKGN